MQRYSDDSMVQQQETSCGVEAYCLDVCKRFGAEKTFILEGIAVCNLCYARQQSPQCGSYNYKPWLSHHKRIGGVETDMQGKDMANDPESSERSTRCDIMMRSVCSHHALI